MKSFFAKAPRMHVGHVFPTLKSILPPSASIHFRSSWSESTKFAQTLPSAASAAITMRASAYRARMDISQGACPCVLTPCGRAHAGRWGVANPKCPP